MVEQRIMQGRTRPIRPTPNTGNTEHGEHRTRGTPNTGDNEHGGQRTWRHAMQDTMQDAGKENVFFDGGARPPLE